MSKSPKLAECDFHFDEMVWRSDSGLIHQALSELTSIRGDVERQIFLIRAARSMSGIGDGRLKQWQTSAFGRVFEELLSRVLHRVLPLCESLLRFIQVQRCLLNKHFVGRSAAMPNQQISPKAKGRI